MEKHRKNKTFRYVICGRCGLKWNIAKTQDTRKGYICPNCAGMIDSASMVEVNLCKLPFEVTYQKGGRLHTVVMTKKEFMDLMEKKSIRLLNLEVMELEGIKNEKKGNKGRA